jgi:hypothetical protein
LTNLHCLNYYSCVALSFTISLLTLLIRLHHFFDSTTSRTPLHFDEASQLLFVMGSDTNDLALPSDFDDGDDNSSIFSENGDEIQLPYNISNDCDEDDIRNSLRLAKDAQDIVREGKVIAHEIEAPLNEAQAMSEAGFRLHDLLKKAATLAVADFMSTVKFALLGSSGEGKYSGNSGCLFLYPNLA